MAYFVKGDRPDPEDFEFRLAEKNGSIVLSVAPAGGGDEWDILEITPQGRLKRFGSFACGYIDDVGGFINFDKEDPAYKED